MKETRKGKQSTIFLMHYLYDPDNEHTRAPLVCFSMTMRIMIEKRSFHPIPSTIFNCNISQKQSQLVILFHIVHILTYCPALTIAVRANFFTLGVCNVCLKHSVIPPVKTKKSL